MMTVIIRKEHLQRHVCHTTCHSPLDFIYSIKQRSSVRQQDGLTVTSGRPAVSAGRKRAKHLIHNWTM